VRDLVTKAKEKWRPELASVMVGATVDEGKVALVVIANDAAIALGVTAGDVLKAALTMVDGRGGGKPDMAQGGGTKVAGLQNALIAARDLVTSKVGA
jgi:alanyl-tRNA synthetase